MSQQDFWGTFEGTIDGSAESANVESLAFETIPAGTKAPAMLIEFELTDNQGLLDYQAANGIPVIALEQYYEATWKVLGGDFKNRQQHQKIRPWKVVEFGENKGQPDQKARTRQANILRRIMMITECPQPMREGQPHRGAPETTDLAACLNKPAAIGFEIWENMNKDTGVWNNGNWLNEVNPIMPDFEPETGTRMPKHAAGTVDPAHQSGSVTGSDQAATQQPVTTGSTGVNW